MLLCASTRHTTLALRTHPSCVILCSMMSDWVVELVDDNISDMYVEFAGPKDSE